MDERTESEKIYDTALNTEKRTIGHRMSRKVLVVAPEHRRAQQWAHEHGIAFSDTIYVGPHNYYTAFRGIAIGTEHVILGWSNLPEEMRAGLKQELLAVESVPFEGDPSDVGLLSADPVRG